MVDVRTATSTCAPYLRTLSRNSSYTLAVMLAPTSMHHHAIRFTFPKSLEPYHIHIVTLSPAAIAKAQTSAANCAQKARRALLDNLAERPRVKLFDAGIIRCPAD